MELAKVTAKGQITIPKEIRELLHLDTGTKVLFVEEGGKIYIMNADALSIRGGQAVTKGQADAGGQKEEKKVIDVIKQLREGK